MLLYLIELHALRAAKYKMIACCAVVPSRISLIIRETIEYWRKLRDKLWDTPYSDSNIRAPPAHGCMIFQQHKKVLLLVLPLVIVLFPLTSLKYIYLNHSHFLLAELCQPFVLMKRSCVSDSGSIGHSRKGEVELEVWVTYRS